jgi:hypothetical protein
LAGDLGATLAQQALVDGITQPLITAGSPHMDVFKTALFGSAEGIGRIVQRIFFFASLLLAKRG